MTAPENSPTADWWCWTEDEPSTFRCRELGHDVRPVRKLGDISYGIFLIHLVVITYVVRLLFEHSTANPSQYEIVNANGGLGTFVALAVIVLPLSVGYGYFSGRYLEQPIRRWAHRFGRRAQVVPASQPTAKAGLRG